MISRISTTSVALVEPWRDWEHKGTSLCLYEGFPKLGVPFCSGGPCTTDYSILAGACIKKTIIGEEFQSLLQDR